MLLRLALIAFLSFVTFTAAADLAPCAQQDHPTGARCGTVTVPLNYDRPDAGNLDLNVIVLPARGGAPVPDPVFYLVGGPGTSARESKSFFSDSMMNLQKTREIVLLDLRGTGESPTFHCSLSAAEKRDVLFAFRSSPGVERCAREIKDRATLRTAVFAHDMDRVRQAIGAKRINLIGMSYGTRLALEYARLYPHHVRASVLRGVSPPAASALTHLMGGAQHEFAVLAERNPGLSEAYRQLTKQLETKPVTVPVGSDEVTVDGVTFGAVTRFLLYDPRTAHSLPALVAATAAGQLGPLGQVVHGVERIVSKFSIPVLLGVLCAEDVPFWDLDDHHEPLTPGPLTPGPFTPGLLRNNAEATCRTWSVPTATAAFKKPVTSTVPTLLLSGEHDPATPADLAEDVSKNLPNSLHLVAPEIGHFPTWTNCYTSIVAAFFNGGSLDRLDVSCVAETTTR